MAPDPTERFSSRVENYAFAVGIATHYGRVAFGNIGLVVQRDATIIGNAVNTAFKLEGLMKEPGQKLLVSQALAQALQPTERAHLHDLGRQKLKGKNEMVHVYGLQSGRVLPGSPRVRHTARCRAPAGQHPVRPPEL